MLKDFFNYVWLINKTDDAYLSVALWTGKRVCFIDLSDEVRPSWIAIFRVMLAQLAPEAARKIGAENARRVFMKSAGQE